MKKSEIKEVAAQILASNPKMTKVFMASDGQGFTTDDKRQAHQRTLGKTFDMEAVKREIVKDDTNDSDDADVTLLDLTVPKLKTALADVDNTADLEELAVEETAKGDDARKGALEAIATRIAEIEAANDLPEED